MSDVLKSLPCSAIRLVRAFLRIRVHAASIPTILKRTTSSLQIHRSRLPREIFPEWEVQPECIEHLNDGPILLVRRILEDV
jgi:hypothetical protein